MRDFFVQQLIHFQKNFNLLNQNSKAEREKNLFRKTFTRRPGSDIIVNNINTRDMYLGRVFFDIFCLSVFLQVEIFLVKMPEKLVSGI